MASWMPNIAPVIATCEIIVDRLPSLREIGVERHRRKKTEEEETKEQQEDDDDHYDTVSKIKLINERKSIKEFRVTGNLNGANAGRIIAKISPGIEMWTKVIYLFKSKIHQGAGEIVDYSQKLTSLPGMFTSLRRFNHTSRNLNQKQ